MNDSVLLVVASDVMFGKTAGGTWDQLFQYFAI